jgi:hypothetical protein
MDHPCRALTKVPSSRIATAFAIVAFLAGGTAPVALAQSPPPAAGPAAAAPMKPLGGERYQIGKIIVDRKAKSFTVPGRVIHIDEAPLEYLAVGRAGAKGYESMLELDTVGTEFNLACILLGLDNSERRRPEFQFDRRPPEGPRVTIELQWQADGKKVRMAAHEALKTAAPPESGPAPQLPPTEWVYTGSFDPEGETPYAADVTGTIIGFVHDPASIIEHRAGLGIGAYGSIQGNAAVLPPIGSEVEVIVTVPASNTEKK